MQLTDRFEDKKKKRGEEQLVGTHVLTPLKGAH